MKTKTVSVAPDIEDFIPFTTTHLGCRVKSFYRPIADKPGEWMEMVELSVEGLPPSKPLRLSRPEHGKLWRT